MSDDESKQPPLKKTKHDEEDTSEAQNEGSIKSDSDDDIVKEILNKYRNTKSKTTYGNDPKLNEEFNVITLPDVPMNYVIPNNVEEPEENPKPRDINEEIKKIMDTIYKIEKDARDKYTNMLKENLIEKDGKLFKKYDEYFTQKMMALDVLDNLDEKIREEKYELVKNIQGYIKDLEAKAAGIQDKRDEPKQPAPKKLKPGDEIKIEQDKGGDSTISHVNPDKGSSEKNDGVENKAFEPTEINITVVTTDETANDLSTGTEISSASYTIISLASDQNQLIKPEPVKEPAITSFENTFAESTTSARSSLVQSNKSPFKNAHQSQLSSNISIQRSDFFNTMRNSGENPDQGSISLPLLGHTDQNSHQIEGNEQTRTFIDGQIQSKVHEQNKDRVTPGTSEYHQNDYSHVTTMNNVGTTVTNISAPENPSLASTMETGDFQSVQQDEMNASLSIDDIEKKTHSEVTTVADGNQDGHNILGIPKINEKPSLISLGRINQDQQTISGKGTSQITYEYEINADSTKTEIGVPKQKEIAATVPEYPSGMATGYLQDFNINNSMALNGSNKALSDTYSRIQQGSKYPNPSISGNQDGYNHLGLPQTNQDSSYMSLQENQGRSITISNDIPPNADQDKANKHTVIAKDANLNSLDASENGTGQNYIELTEPINHNVLKTQNPDEVAIDMVTIHREIENQQPPSTGVGSFPYSDQNGNMETELFLPKTDEQWPNATKVLPRPRTNERYDSETGPGLPAVQRRSGINIKWILFLVFIIIIILIFVTGVILKTIVFREDRRYGGGAIDSNPDAYDHNT